MQFYIDHIVISGNNIEKNRCYPNSFNSKVNLFYIVNNHKKNFIHYKSIVLVLVYHGFKNM